MKEKIKKTLPFIGAFCLLVLTLVNYFIENNFFKNCINISLFLFVLILYFVSRDYKKDELKLFVFLDKRSCKNTV
ncbi:hypothetical protein ACT7C6_02475 [Bacillus paranthracis]